MLIITLFVNINTPIPNNLAQFLYFFKRSFYLLSRLIILLLIFFSSTLLAQSPRVSAQADIELFVRQGCPYCAQAETFLHQLKREQTTLTIIIHDIAQDNNALQRLQLLARELHVNTVRVPAFYVSGQLIIGYSDEINTGQWIKSLVKNHAPAKLTNTINNNAGSCEAGQSLSCEAEKKDPQVQIPIKQHTSLDFFGYPLTLEKAGLPLFTIAMGLLDGFNPCSMWVLLLMISLLAPLANRGRMLAIAGTFVLVEGVAYFIFMAAWLNLFLLIGLSRISQIIIALIALLAGLLNLKDFLHYRWGFSLSIPDSAKPKIYVRMRAILQARSLYGAIIGVALLAILVQLVEFLCTSGFPALFTRILTLQQLNSVSYYAYLVLYNVAYLFDDIIILGIGVITLSQRRLQEKEGRFLKLLSAVVMLSLGIYLLLT